MVHCCTLFSSHLPHRPLSVDRQLTTRRDSLVNIFLTGKKSWFWDNWEVCVVDLFNKREVSRAHFVWLCAPYLLYCTRFFFRDRPTQPRRLLNISLSIECCFHIIKLIFRFYSKLSSSLSIPSLLLMFDGYSFFARAAPACSIVNSRWIIYESSSGSSRRRSSQHH